MISDIMITDDDDEDESPEYVRVRDMVIGDVCDVLEKYHIAGEELRDFLWRQVATEYTKELVEGKMTEDQVLEDINRTSPIIVKYITKAYHSILAENGQTDLPS